MTKYFNPEKLFKIASLIKIMLDMSLVALLISLTTFGTISDNYFYYIVFFVFVGLSFVNIFIFKESKSVFIDLHTLWYALFIIFALLSSLWAVDDTAVMKMMSKPIQILILTYCINMYITKKSDLLKLIKYYILVCSFMAVYILINTPYSRWFSGFVGNVTNYNTNSVGMTAAFAAIFAFYFLLKEKKYLYFAAFFLLTFIIILTSSRKSLLIIILGIFILLTLYMKRRYYFTSIIAVIVFIIIFFIMIYNIPKLYSSIGMRINSMLESLVYNNDIDSSIAQRETFIYYAKIFYYERPIFGNGLNNFAVLIADYVNNPSYAHNNYFEIASGLGSVGLIVYYWFYIYTIVKLFKFVLRGIDLALPFFAIFVALIIFEYGFVSYYGTITQIIITMSFMAICIAESELKLKNAQNGDIKL